MNKKQLSNMDNFNKYRSYNSSQRIAAFVGLVGTAVSMTFLGVYELTIIFLLFALLMSTEVYYYYTIRHTYPKPFRRIIALTLTLVILVLITESILINLPAAVLACLIVFNHYDNLPSDQDNEH